MLALKKPLAFIDLEATGMNLGTDRIVEIAIVRIATDNTRQVKRKLINPEIPIPQVVTDIHGLTNEFLDNCDLGGYNSNRFDIPLLMEEFLRSGIDFDMKGRRLLDVQRIYHMMEQRTLTAAYKFYCEKDLVGAHGAEADVVATYEVLEAQLLKYEHLGNTMDSILKFTGEEMIVDFARRFIMENGIEIFNFGKYKGKVVADVLRSEPQYYDWMMKGDFTLHTKQKLTEIFNRALLKKG
jgi:DNA polymerase-3 subunit epsilon